jgi:hypothetical protein
MFLGMREWLLAEIDGRKPEKNVKVAIGDILLKNNTFPVGRGREYSSLSRCAVARFKSELKTTHAIHLYTVPRHGI